MTEEKTTKWNVREKLLKKLWGLIRDGGNQKGRVSWKKPLKKSSRKKKYDRG